VGQQRDGGNYVARMGRIAVWDSVMDEHNYLVRRWNEFMRACRSNHDPTMVLAMLSEPDLPAYTQRIV